jgi:hypothetical protein
VDTSVSGTVTGNAPLYRVTISAAGLPAGSTGTLRVVPDRLVLAWNVGPRCDRVRDGLVCEVSAADPTVTLNVVALPGTSLTATLDAGEDDPDPANNTWRGRLD